MKTRICHDCACEEGQLHEYGCDMERCPFCGNQLITCDCCYRSLGFEPDPDHPTYGLPGDIYENGLTDELLEKWIEILIVKGRIPYISYPNLCARCGMLWPDMFSVPDEEWERYVEPRQRGKVLCWDCYCEIKRLCNGALQF